MRERATPVGSTPRHPYSCRGQKPQAPATTDPGQWMQKVVRLTPDGPYARRWTWVPDRKAQAATRWHRDAVARAKMRQEEEGDQVLVDVRSTSPGARRLKQLPAPSGATPRLAAVVVAATMTSC